jgi:transcriptional regulator with XRE-family HTH domain
LWETDTIRPDRLQTPYSDGHEQSELHTRLISAVDGRSYREIGDLTGVHPETVRRYMQGQAPSVDFLTNLCRALGLSGSWLLTGDGVMHVSETKGRPSARRRPRSCSPTMAGTLGGLIDRVGRLEGYLQTLETRVRVRPPS